MDQGLGPVEHLVVSFDGNQFNGGIVSALHELVDDGLIRILDLAVIMKDKDGNALIVEASELTDEVSQALAKFDCSLMGLLTEQDLLDEAELLPANSTAASMLFENVWAARFAKAIRQAEGQVVLNERIPNNVAEEMRATLIEASKLL
ncbi:MAG: hypothetical protein KBD67_06390 [Anaerolineaceae bacterium]|nr:hypothetical protein [Anaerolineaceae bacterium]